MNITKVTADMMRLASLALLIFFSSSLAGCGSAPPTPVAPTHSASTPDAAPVADPIAVEHAKTAEKIGLGTGWSNSIRELRSLPECKIALRPLDTRRVSGVSEVGPVACELTSTDPGGLVLQSEFSWQEKDTNRVKPVVFAGAKYFTSELLPVDLDAVISQGTIERKDQRHGTRVLQLQRLGGMCALTVRAKPFAEDD